MTIGNGVRYKKNHLTFQILVTLYFIPYQKQKKVPKHLFYFNFVRGGPAVHFGARAVFGPEALRPPHP